MQRLLFTEHALEAMRRRRLPVRSVALVARSPEQVLSVRPGRVIAQSIRQMDGPPGVYLPRVVLDLRTDAAEVVTAYRTTSIGRYWRGVS